MDDIGVASLAAAHCASRRTLQHLDLTRCELVTGTSIARVATACPQLRTLRITQCLGVTSDDVEQIARRSPFLTIEFTPSEAFANPKKPQLVPGFVKPPAEATFEVVANSHTWVLPPGAKGKGKKGSGRK